MWCGDFCINVCMYVFSFTFFFYSLKYHQKKKAESPPDGLVGRYRLLSDPELGTVFSQDSHNNLVQA